ncbi:MAG: thiamine pyrophosphate-binding protein [Candidatus Erginobacter occultus]|nr:thiamine pyrophosphate-binding protein [Candidatus Erginobacter occultus]
MKMNGAGIMVKSLEDLGVERVFGYTGAAILPVFDALGESPIAITVNANEQSCAFSAAGYSRAGDRTGVAVVTSGPAITNTLTAVADSHTDSIPLLVFAGQVQQSRLGTDEFQHINVREVFAKAAKKVIQVTDPNRVEETVKDAWFYARSGKPGAVVIDFPLDIQRGEAEFRGLEVERYRLKYEQESHLGENQCRRFFELLEKSRRPLLYIGGGVNSREASRHIREFNRLFEIPSIISLMAKGVVDETLDTSLGMLGMFGTPGANTAIQETDLFVAFGVRWNDRVSQRVGESGLEAEIAYIDINAEKVQEVRVTRNPKFSFIGDASTVLEDLLDYARRHPVRLEIGQWRLKAAELKQRYRLDYNRAAKPIQAAGVMELLSRRLTEETRITTGVGQHQMLAAQYLPMARPKSFLTAGAFGTMGFALSAAVGAHFADPAARTIAIDGDGSIKMNLGEIHTIGALGLPIKVLLLNNHADGMVRTLQAAVYGRRFIATEREFDADFSRIAAECGFAWHRKVREREELEGALDEFLEASGPCFLEVVTDREEGVFPFIPAGKGYRDMVLGPYIGKGGER